MFSASNFIIGGSTQSVSFGYYSNFNTGVINAGGPYGITNQSGNAIAIGNNAAQYNQWGNAIAIGQNVGQYSQGKNAIAIGNNAGVTLQNWNSIILNASGNVIVSSNNFACYIHPIQDKPVSVSSTNCLLTYNSTSSEVNYNSKFKFIPWTDCGYTLISSASGNTFGGAVSATTTAPTPATNSTMTYKYSVFGNTMFLQFCYNGNTTNAGGSGNGVYFYNLPSGFSINTSMIQTVSPGAPGTTNQTAYGTILGSATLEYLPGGASAPAYSNSCYIYSNASSKLCIFSPTLFQTTQQT